MSRSYRKPYFSWCSSSMQEDKKIYHGRHRAKIRAILDTFVEGEDFHTPVKNIETSDVYTMARDGKQTYMSKPKSSDADWLKKEYKRIKRK